MGAKFVLELIVGNRLYRVPYEYARLIRLAAVGAPVYGISALVHWDSLAVTLSYKAALLLAAPVALYLTGFLEPEELARLRGALGRAWRWAGALPSGGRP
jgi:hypothetical protein